MFLSHGGGPLPLHVCYGMEKRAAGAVVPMRILNKNASLYIW